MYRSGVKPWNSANWKPGHHKTVDASYPEK